MNLCPDTGLFFQDWLSHRFSYLDWMTPFTVTLDELFQTCVIHDEGTPGNAGDKVPDSNLQQTLKALEPLLWSQDRATWMGLNDRIEGDWTPVAGSAHTFVNKALYPGRMFEFFEGVDSANAVPGSFFLRAAAAREMQEAIDREGLTRVCLPKMYLVALASKDAIKMLPEADQCRQFILVIDTRDMNIQGNEPRTVMDAATCRELAQLCCLGFPIHTNAWTSDGGTSTTAKLVILLASLSCFSLNEPDQIPNQYGRTRELRDAQELLRLNLARANLPHLRLLCQFFGGQPRVFDTALYELDKHVLRVNKTARELCPSCILPSPKSRK